MSPSGAWRRGRHRQLTLHQPSQNTSQPQPQHTQPENQPANYLSTTIREDHQPTIYRRPSERTISQLSIDDHQRGPSANRRGPSAGQRRPPVRQRTGWGGGEHWPATCRERRWRSVASTRRRGSSPSTRWWWCQRASGRPGGSLPPPSPWSAWSLQRTTTTEQLDDYHWTTTTKRLPLNDWMTSLASAATALTLTSLL